MSVDPTFAPAEQTICNTAPGGEAVDGDGARPVHRPRRTGRTVRTAGAGCRPAAWGLTVCLAGWLAGCGGNGGSGAGSDAGHDAAGGSAAWSMPHATGPAAGSAPGQTQTPDAAGSGAAATGLPVDALPDRLAATPGTAATDTPAGDPVTGDAAAGDAVAGDPAAADAEALAHGEALKSGGASPRTVVSDAATPFAARSVWRSRPNAPVLGTTPLPATSYFPMVSEGAYSTGVFVAKSTDAPLTVTGYGGRSPMDQDPEQQVDVTLPRWPVVVLPATGTDGHAEIVDPVAGIVHSFFQLAQVDGVWRASMHSWSPLAGMGAGDPAHYSQGARASGVPSMAGLIRTQEIGDGDSMYRHALAMSLDGSALKAGYVYPATSEDWDSGSTYTGQIPMGSLMMLPASFDPATLSSAALRKVAQTLKTYGARVVDRNVQTRFGIYVQNGSGFSLMPNGWDNAVAADLTRIADALRPMLSSTGYTGADGVSFTPVTNLNRLSMRGPWQASGGGTGPGTFDSYGQQLVFPASNVRLEQTQWSRNGAHRVSWAPWTAGATYRFTVTASGGAQMKLQMRTSVTAAQVFVDTGWLSNGQSATFTMPADTGYPVLVAASGTGGTVSTVGASLVRR